MKTPEPKIEPEITIEPSMEPIEEKSPPKGITLTEAATAPLPQVALKSKNPAPPPVRQKEPVKKVEKILPPSESQTMVDLTNKFKLTSTGTSANGRYASIDGITYYLGDEFEGMILTNIQRDRVFLKEKKGWQQYKIVFRYKN